MSRFRTYRSRCTASNLCIMAMNLSCGDPFTSMGLAVAFAEGLEARRNGASRHGNPYFGAGEATEAAEAWIDGWDQCPSEFGLKDIRHSQPAARV